jgi:hypothetical protein
VAVVEVLIRANVINPFVCPAALAIGAAIPRDPRRGERGTPLLADPAGGDRAPASWSPSTGSASRVALQRVRVLRLATETWVAALAAAPVVLMYPLFLVVFGRSATTIVMIGFVRRPAARDPEDARGPAGAPPRADRRRPQLPAHASQMFRKILLPPRCLRSSWDCASVSSSR